MYEEGPEDNSIMAEMNCIGGHLARNVYSFCQSLYKVIFSKVGNQLTEDRVRCSYKFKWIKWV